METTTSANTTVGSVSPSTYEDCMTIITQGKAATQAADKDAALNRLEGFFKQRMSKKANEASKDGGAAVKSAIERSRAFVPYGQRPTA
jgi:hypothetical protein